MLFAKRVDALMIVSSVFIHEQSNLEAKISTFNLEQLLSYMIIHAAQGGI